MSIPAAASCRPIPQRDEGARHRSRLIRKDRVRRLWDRWKDPANGEWVLSCAIIVSGASAWVEPYHDRMPVLLEAQDLDCWLDGSLGPKCSSGARRSPARLEGIAAAQSHSDDDPTIIEPLPQPAGVS